MRKVIKNKKINNREKLDAYEYEVYNKIEFDINNIDSSFTQRKVMKPFQFIFENIDSSERKPFLPVMISENISDFYYRRTPKGQKEIIKATRVSGLQGSQSGVNQFMGDMYQNVNVYDNFITMFGKSFMSPTADIGLLSYRYYLLDSAYIDNDWCYKIRFKPRRKHELTFDGEMWINDTTYAIKQIEASMSGDASINWITEFAVKQKYDQVEKEVWMLIEDKLVVDFNAADKTMGF